MNFDKWHQLREKTADLSLRERAILAGTGVVLVGVIWAQFVFTPYEKQQARLSQERQSLTTQIADDSNRLVELTAMLANDPNAPLRAEQQRLNDEMEAVKQEIEGRLSSLIAPEEMANVLRGVLSDYKGLELISARNLPVEPLDIKKALGAKSSGAPASSDQAVIFAHGFELVLSGSFFQTLEFLQKLETTKGFYWRMLDYSVTSYPKAKVILQISTLSLDEDWIGV
ncbi:MAG: hypothetical protein R3183_06445 [Oleiphilaceae bacterium]|nr:hypothetical protein [Oleiphilaceae bacterium]